MNRYRYKAIDDKGKYINGKVSAINPAELFSMLRSSGLEIISYKIEKQSLLLNFVPSRIKTKDLITTFIHLEQLDRAGVPIVDSISDLKDSSDSAAIRALMYEIYESIKNGSLFSEALAQHPNIFNSVYIGLVASAEKTGNLANAFTSIVDDLKWNAEFKRKIRKASSGPIFGILIMCVIIGVMMGVVVPKVSGFLELQEIAMPTTTKSLIITASFIKNNWIILLLFFPIIFLILKVAAKVPEIGVKLDDIKLKLPIVGPILTKIDAAKFCQFFSMTFKSGIGVIDCLDSAAMVIKNSAIRRDVLHIKQQVSEGQSLARSIATSIYFPSLVARMFKVGEESGNMEEALNNIKFFYDREINDAIDRLVSMIQPTLTIVMGGMIFWVTIAVFGPIYGSFSKIK